MIGLNKRNRRHGRNSTELLEQLTFSPALLIFHLYRLFISFGFNDNEGFPSAAPATKLPFFVISEPL